MRCWGGGFAWRKENCVETLEVCVEGDKSGEDGKGEGEGVRESERISE